MSDDDAMVARLRAYTGQLERATLESPFGALQLVEASEEVLAELVHFGERLALVSPDVTEPLLELLEGLLAEIRPIVERTGGAGLEASKRLASIAEILRRHSAVPRVPAVPSPSDPWEFSFRCFSMPLCVEAFGIVLGRNELIYTHAEQQIRVQRRVPRSDHAALWAVIEALGVERWNAEYNRDALDGFAWGISVVRRGGEFKASGFNAWPPGHDVLIDAIDALAAGTLREHLPDLLRRARPGPSAEDKVPTKALLEVRCGHRSMDDLRAEVLERRRQGASAEEIDAIASQHPLGSSSIEISGGDSVHYDSDLWDHQPTIEVVIKRKTPANAGKSGLTQDVRFTVTAEEWRAIAEALTGPLAPLMARKRWSRDTT